MSKIRLSLCMITSDADLDRAVALAKKLEPYVDEVCLTATGKNGFVGGKIKTTHFDWCNDFSAARNFNFAQAKGDWIIWLDADDAIDHPENLRKLIDDAEKIKLDGYWFLYKYDFDENGNCIDQHWKGQLLRNDGHFKWMGAIHEDPIQQRTARWSKTDAVTRIHKSTKERGKESYERNIRILELEREKNPTEPRTRFYLGRSYIASGRFQEAIDELTHYLTLSGWDEERYEARLLMGQCFFMGGQYSEALEQYNSAILEREDYPDAYIQKGMCYMKQKSWGKALVNFSIAQRQTIPSASTFFNPMLYSRDLCQAISVCYLSIGKFNEALKFNAEAYKADPKNRQIVETYNLITSLKRKYDTSRHYLEIVKYLQDKGEESKVLPLVASLPKDLLDDPVMLKVKFDYLKPEKWTTKSIAVYCGNTVEPWTTKAQNGGGIGGSETAVIELGKRLVRDGFEVTVFNNCNAPSEGIVEDGITFKNYWQFNYQDEFDVLWVWRMPELFDLKLKARFALLDLHDVPNGMEFTPERLARMDKIFVKSKYHRSLLPNVPDDKFVVVGNGIDVDRYKFYASTRVEKDPLRFIYSSTPNRGLDILLGGIWQKIKEAYPEATLHTYYGWNTYYELEKNNPERMSWMTKMKKLMDETPGVVNHGRVGQKELAQDQLASSFWLYPTYFPEIHCITACEMQAAGVVPITSGFAALAETQQSGLKLEGDVYDPKWQDNFAQEVINKVKDETWLKEERNHAISVSLNFDWDLVVEEWKKYINEA